MNQIESACPEIFANSGFLNQEQKDLLKHSPRKLKELHIKKHSVLSL